MQVLYDLRLAARSLARARRFYFAIVALLALGIGASTAIYSLAQRTLLDPLPYPNSDRIVAVLGAGMDQLYGGLKWWQQAKSLSFMAEEFVGSVDLVVNGRAPQYLAAVAVSPDYFRVFAVPPALGRGFTASDAQPGDRAVVLSHGLWVRQFGGDARVLGRTVTIAGQPARIVGVMPRGFTYPGHTALWIAGEAPSFAMPMGRNRQADVLGVQGTIGRLKPGVPVETATAEIQGLQTLLRRQPHPKNQAFGTPPRVRLLRDVFVYAHQESLELLIGAVALLFLIACADAGGMLLARSAARRPEMAVRSCLGAGPARLARQLACELVLLAAAATALGLALGWLLLTIVRAIGPADVPGLADAALNPTAIAFACGAALVAALLAGLAPLGTVLKPNLASALQSAGSPATRQRLRSVFVIAQFALGVVLLLGAALLIRSLANLARQATGFTTESVVTLNLHLPVAPLRSSLPTDLAAFNLVSASWRARAVAAASGLAGVRSLGTTSALPLAHEPRGYYSNLVGHPVKQDLFADTSSVGGDYFATLGIPLLAGRAFAPTDSNAATPALIVNEAYARHFFGSSGSQAAQRALGAHVDIQASPPSPPRTIIGVVADTRLTSLSDEFEPQIFVPASQPVSMAADDLALVARVSGPSGPALGALTDRLTSLGISTYQPRAMSEVVRDSVAGPRFNALLLGFFALIAWLLACLGIYGLMAHRVIARTRELGIRMALGARPRVILAMVVREGFARALLGIAVGLVAAEWLARLIASLLFHVPAHSPGLAVAAALGMLVAALAASALPAYRAARLDPALALRRE